ncbi:hypothetical protein IF650_11765 [Cellulosimicrobium terreum]|nr:hypothetical protein [Cellulosimicrobium terreum]
MSNDDQTARDSARDPDDTLDLAASTDPAPTRPLGDAIFEPRAGDPVAADPAAADPAAGPSTTAIAPRRPRGPRVGTIVWGFIIVALGGAVLASALGARFDMGLAAIVVLAVAGVTLLVGSIVAGARRRPSS